MMGMKFKEITDIIEKIAPSFLVEEWDNDGIQIKTSNDDIEKILIALEINEEVIQEAIMKQVGLIITHHPLFFEDVKQINRDTTQGRHACDLIIHGISVYSSHTTFDKAIGGNNDCLIGMLHLDMTSLVGTGNFQEFGIGRLISLKKPMTLEQVRLILMRQLDIPECEIRYIGNKNKEIKIIGVCTGSGASLLEDAIDNKCDLLITGDVKYHDAQKAKSSGISLIDAGHFHTEKIFARNFGEKLVKLSGGKVKVILSQINLNPFE